MLSDYMQRTASTFKRYYQLKDQTRQIRPICGDYLANVAIVMEEAEGGEEKK